MENEEVPLPQLPNVSSRGKRKSCPNYSLEEEGVIVLETHALRAYCTPSKQAELFSSVARKLNQNQCCQGESTSRSVRDRFFRLVTVWPVQEENKKRMSGISETVTDVDKALCDIVKVMDYGEDTKRAVKEIEKEKKRKLADSDDAFFVQATTSRGMRVDKTSACASSNADADISSASDSATPSKRQRKQRAQMQDSEFDRMILMMESSAAEDRRQRELDREQQNQQFKMAMDTFLAAVKVLKG